MNSGLDSLLPHIPAALLVLFRLMGIFIFGPVFGASVVPLKVKVLLAMVLTVCVYPIIPPQLPVALNITTIAIGVGSELLIGAAIGYGASLPLVGLQIAGVMMGHQLGLALAQVFNPEFDEQTEVLSQFMFLVALTAFLLLGGHHAMLGSLIHSFEHIPLGGTVPTANLLEFSIGLLTSMVELGVRVSAPLLCLVFLETVAMGFVARTVPQLNILSLGFPMRIILGFFVLVGLSATMFNAVGDEIENMMSALFQLVRI